MVNACYKERILKVYMLKILLSVPPIVHYNPSTMVQPVKHH
jgi:hypothetical protein